MQQTLDTSKRDKQAFSLSLLVILFSLTVLVFVVLALFNHHNHPDNSHPTFAFLWGGSVGFVISSWFWLIWCAECAPKLLRLAQRCCFALTGLWSGALLAFICYHGSLPPWNWPGSSKALTLVPVAFVAAALLPQHCVRIFGWWCIVSCACLTFFLPSRIFAQTPHLHPVFDVLACLFLWCSLYLVFHWLPEFSSKHRLEDKP